MFTLQPLRFDFHSFRARLVGLSFAFFALSGAMLAFIAPAAAQFGGASDSGGATVLHVAEVASPGGDGSSWAAAFSRPQQALIAAAGISGSVLIKVAQGRYVPTLRTDAADPRSVTFQLRNNTTLSGGYAGPGESDPDARNTSLYETILSGDINGDDQPNFVNNGDNARNILIAEFTDTSAVLDGFTVTGGNGQYGAGIKIRHGQPSITTCTFSSNNAYMAGGLFVSDSAFLVLTNCEFLENRSEEHGSAIRCADSHIVLSHCTFARNTSTNGATVTVLYDTLPFVGSCVIDSCNFILNTTGGAGGGLQSHVPTTVAGSLFLSNSAEVGGGGMVLSKSLTVSECAFISNHGGLAGGAVTATDENSPGGPPASFVNCAFSQNTSNYYGGAVAWTGMHATGVSFINCSFSRNSGPVGGSLLITGDGPVTIGNSSIVASDGSAITLADFTDSVDVQNSILWESATEHIVISSPDPPPPPGFGDLLTVSFSNIQGGWTGAGTNNIDEDPLFIQTSCDNLRLAHDSPCIDAGSNALIPPGITTDLAGNPRIQNGIVDMGAYEGGHDILPPAACADYLAQGINVRLVPNGGAFSPLNNPAIVIRNEDDPNLGNAMVMQHDFPLHPSGGGFNEIGSALQVNTSIPNGGFWMRVILPFTPSNLNGFDPEDVELTFFDEKDNEWKLAAIANLANSPGHSGPLGDRLFTQGTTNQFGLSPDLGDYGVFWNPQLQQGFAWANVDHATDFAIGIRLPQCAGDCAYPGDGLVSPVDAQAVITAWGLAQNGPLSFADITEDGRVGTFDLLEVINHWGPCP